MTSMTTVPSFYWLRWELKNFLPGLSLNHNPPDFSTLSSWYYKNEPPHLAKKKKKNFKTGSPYVAQAGLKLTILLPQPPK
jgi:hypothetical protein